MSNDEVSPGGSKMLRHEAKAGGGDVGHADDERISAHLEQHLGPLGMVFHELVSDRVHIDVHTVPPTAARPYVALVTSGMSAKPMTVPADLDGRDQWMHAELCLFLPPTWPLEQAQLSDERHYWPIRLLKMLARLPHEYGSWLGWGHSIPNGDPAQPYAPDTLLAGALVVPPFDLAEAFFTAEGSPTLHFFQVLPVTAAEMAFKLKHGVDKTLDKLEQKLPALYGPIDPARKSAV